MMFHQLLTIVNVHILRKHVCIALGNSTSDITFLGLLLLELLDPPVFLEEFGKIVNVFASILDALDLLL